MSTQIAQLYAKIGADTAGFEKGMKSSHTALASFSTALGTGLVAAAALGVAAIGGVAVAVGKGVKAAASFEQNLADIASTAGMTLKEVAPLKKYLFDLALDPKLKVNLDEASDAAASLIKNGLTMEQVMGGAARSVVLLANATGADFGSAADMTTNVMQMFNVEAANMDKAVSQIAGTQQASKMTAQDYAGYIAMAGGVAAAAGVSFEDMNAAGAASAYMFSSGSDAGTSFKRFIQLLTPTTVEAAKEMRNLGLYTGMTGKEQEKAAETIAKLHEKIAALDPTTKGYSDKVNELNAELATVTNSLKDGQNAFYNLDGTMKTMPEIAGLLKNAYAGLTEEQINMSTATLFGTDASRTAFALIAQGTEGINKYKETIGNVSAEDAAATRMDTLSGQWEIFTGTLQGASVMIGDAFLPAMKEIVKWLQATSDKHMPAVITWFEKFGVWIAESLPKIEAWGTAAFNAVSSFTSALISFAKYLAWVIIDGDRLNDWYTNLPEMIQPAVKALGWFVDVIRDLVIRGAMVVEMFTQWGNEGKTGMDIFVLALEWMATSTQRLLGLVVTYVKEQYPIWVAKLKEWGIAAGSWVMDTGWPLLLANLKKWGAQLGTWLKEQLPVFIADLAKWAVQLGAWVIQGIAYLIDNLANGVNKVSRWLNGTGRTAVEGGVSSWVDPMWKWVMDELWPLLKPALEALSKAILKIIGASARLIWEAFWALPRKMITEFQAGLADAWTKFDLWWLHLWDGFIATVSDIWGVFRDFAGAIIQGFKDGFKERWDGFKTWWKDLWMIFVENVNGIFGIHSPSTVFYGIGTNIVLGMANGLVDTMPIIDRVMAGMSKTVTTVVAGMYDQINAATAEIALRASYAGIAAGEMANVHNDLITQNDANSTGLGANWTWADLNARDETLDVNRATTQGTSQGTSITIENLNLGGSGNSAQDILQAVNFINSTYSYGY